MAIYQLYQIGYSCEMIQEKNLVPPKTTGVRAVRLVPYPHQAVSIQIKVLYMRRSRSMSGYYLCSSLCLFVDKPFEKSFGGNR